MISDTLSKVIKDRKGYRTEEYSGSGIRDLEEVLRYEIGTLGNTDTLAFLKKNYKILSDFSLNEDTINDLKETAEDDEDLKQLIIEEEQQIAINNSTYFIEQILDFVDQAIGSSKAIGLWLTTFDNVINRYCGSHDNIDEYDIPEKHVIISDLDIDGALFVWARE